MEPSLLTNVAIDGPLNGIDGNHRLVAQFLSGKGIDEVAVLVCTHPMMLAWCNISHEAREWYEQKTAVNRSG
jgi:hypothetical protein